MKDNSDRKSVLIVEDDYPSYCLLKFLLEPVGINIIRAVSGEEAIQIYYGNPDIDLIIMDINLPVLNGIKATQIIRESNTDIPIIIYSACSVHFIIEKAKLAGCSEFIPKPIAINDFLNKIIHYLDKINKSGQVTIRS